MGIMMDILETLWNTNLNYKGIHVNIFGFPVSKKHYNRSLSPTLSRLNKQGFVINKDEEWSITTKGKKYVKEKKFMRQFESPFADKSPRNLLLIFDIPESQKTEREWFRRHLRKFDYIMIQKSVWVGPSPLPTEFKLYLKEIGLKDFVKTFKLGKTSKN